MKYYWYFLKYNWKRRWRKRQSKWSFSLSPRELILLRILFLDHFALNTLFITEDLIPYLRLMKEDLIHAYEVILVRKNSPYLFHLNHVITRLWEGGLFFYMNQVTVLRTMSTHLQLAVRNSQDVSYVFHF